MVSKLIGAITFIFVVRALYQLLGEASKTQASLMLTLVLCEAIEFGYQLLKSLSEINLTR